MNSYKTKLPYCGFQLCKWKKKSPDTHHSMFLAPTTQAQPKLYIPSEVKGQVSGLLFSHFPIKQTNIHTTKAMGQRNIAEEIRDLTVIGNIGQTLASVRLWKFKDGGS